MGFFEYYLAGWNIAALVCLLVGLALMVVEMFTPGLGVSGVLGGLSLIACIVLSANSILNALVTLIIILVLLGIAAFFILRSA